MKLTIVLPCYNEEDSVKPVLTELINEKKNIISNTKIEAVEIIVVDDGSTDRSAQRLSSFAALNVKTLTHQTNKGYGAALKTGIASVKHDGFIAFYDFDGTCHPVNLIQMLNLAINKNIKLVVGKRTHAKSKMPLHRFIGNWLYIFLSKLIFKNNISDLCSGYRLFRAELGDTFIKKLPDGLNFTLAMTILSVKTKVSMAEVSVEYSERIGTSKLNSLLHGFQFLFTLLVHGMRKNIEKN